MTAALDFIVPALATASILIALFFFWRALKFRSRSSVAAFGVAQQEARQAMWVESIRGIAAAFVGLILFSVVGLNPTPPGTEAEPTRPLPTLTSAAPVNTAQPSATPTVQPPASPTADRATAEPATTTPLEAPTATPTATETPTSSPATATVSSGVGVWLRSIPSTEGEQLEWVLDGTLLTLLPGFETAEDLEWQQVRTPQGNEGWVAVPFIVYNQ